MTNEKNAAADFKLKIQHPHTTMDSLRTVLKTLDTRISQLKVISANDAQEIPALFDQMETLLAQLNEKNVNVTSELGIVDMVTSRFRKNLALFIQKVGGPDVLTQARVQRQPTQDYWWWFADEIVTTNRKKNFIRLARNTGILAVILLIVVVVYQKFFAPSPEFKAMYGHQQRAESLLSENDYENALTEAEAALDYAPDNPELLILTGVLLNAVDQAELAEEYFAAALQVYSENKDTFYVQRSMYNIMRGAYEPALADSETAVTINADSANAYLLMGQVYESLGDNEAAIQSYELADAAAQRSGNAQLQAVSRVNLSNALQRVSLPSFETPEASGGE